MKMNTTIIAAVAALTAAGMTVATSPVSAASAAIESAKSQCVVGERNDGYLGVVPGETAAADLLREIRRVNQERKAAYERLAERNGVSVAVAAALTAERLINSAKSGECVQDASGDWIKKA